MTEPIEVAIPEALYAYLAATPVLSTTPRARPFVPYSPTVGVAYLDVRPLMFAAPVHFNMDFGGSDILTGIFQVDAVVPDEQGQNPGLRLAALIRARFSIGTVLPVVSTIGTRMLYVTDRPMTNPALRDAAWIRFPVSIPFQLIT